VFDTTLLDPLVIPDGQRNSPTSRSAPPATPCARGDGTRRADAGCALSTIRVDLAAIHTAHRLAGVPLDLRDARLAPVLKRIVRTMCPASSGQNLEVNSSGLLNAGTGFPSCVALQVVEC
jgi:hypothetical protein